MGTVFSLDIREPGCDPAAVDDAISWLHWVDDTFSTYKPDSPISRLARGEIGIADCAARRRARSSPAASELQTETDGYFSAYATGSLDPSGLVKGWAIQRVSDQLRAAGSRNHCINGGGDVHCAGSAADGEPMAHRHQPPHPPGPTRRSRHRNRHRRRDIGHRRARRPHPQPPRPQHAVGLASVTIVGKDLGRTDAYATAAFAMGTEAPDWIATLDGYQGLVIRADGSQWTSPQLRDRLVTHHHRRATFVSQSGSARGPLALVRLDFSPQHRQPAAVRVALATVVAIAASLLADALIVVIAERLFPSTKGYVHFQFGDYAKLTIIGVLIACLSWPVITRVSSAPRWIYSRLAVIVTLVLLLPDCLASAPRATHQGGPGANGHAPRDRHSHVLRGHGSSTRRTDNLGGPTLPTSWVPKRRTGRVLRRREVDPGFEVSVFVEMIGCSRVTAT